MEGGNSHFFEDAFPDRLAKTFLAEGHGIGSAGCFAPESADPGCLGWVFARPQHRPPCPPRHRPPRAPSSDRETPFSLPGGPLQLIRKSPCHGSAHDAMSVGGKSNFTVRRSGEGPGRAPANPSFTDFLGNTSNPKAGRLNDSVPASGTAGRSSLSCSPSSQISSLPCPRSRNSSAGWCSLAPVVSTVPPGGQPEVQLR